MNRFGGASRRMAAPLVAAVGALLLAAALARANPMEDLRAPGPLSSPHRPLGTAVAPDYLAILRQAPASGISEPFLDALNWYRTVVSPLDGKRCSMAPTCSLYAQEAFREYGPFWGFILTADRLLHEADEQPYVRSYVQNGQRLFIDPLAANTYWW